MICFAGFAGKKTCMGCLGFIPGKCVYEPLRWRWAYVTEWLNITEGHSYDR